MSLEALEAEVQRLQREHLGENVETGGLVKALGDFVIDFVILRIFCIGFSGEY